MASISSMLIRMCSRLSSVSSSSSPSSSIRRERNQLARNTFSIVVSPPSSESTFGVRMKYSLLIFLLVVPLLLPAQTPAPKPKTNVDNLVAALDSLGAVAYNNWRVSPDLKSPIDGDPSQPGFDDSKWDNLTLNKSIYPDSCWIRREIVLPAMILGKPVSGT